jgi:hypothetical protein
LIRIAHITNPVFAPRDSHFHFVQQVTLESIRQAKLYAHDVIDVTLLTVQYAEDHCMIPNDFQITPDLERSVLDIGKFQELRKLPLIKDILQRAYESTKADYLLYTNVDIGLLPHFYVFVSQVIDAGYDGFVINRRSISDRFSSAEMLPIMYAEVGRPHRGWDCFIFKRELFPSFILGNTCLGAPRVELALYANLMVWCKQFKEFKHLHLTFHLGLDEKWRKSIFEDYADHNTRESIRALETLEEIKGKFPRNTVPGRFLAMQKNRIARFLYDLLIKQVNIPVETANCLRKFILMLMFWKSQPVGDNGEIFLDVSK